MTQWIDPQLDRCLRALAKLETDDFAASDEDIEGRYPGISRAVQRGLVDRYQISNWQDGFEYGLSADGREAIGLPREVAAQQPRWAIAAGAWLGRYLPSWMLS